MAAHARFTASSAERWRAFHPGYEVSDGGQVRRARDGFVLRQRKDRDGYALVDVGPRGARRTVRVARAVLEVFVGPAPAGAEADHQNRVRHDNRLDNLRWLTRAENLRGCRRGGASGIIGVRRSRKSWQSYAVDGRFINLGHFATKAEAAEARRAWEATRGAAR